jgi:L-2-hydroxyglutarate oxidase LhgO
MNDRVFGHSQGRSEVVTGASRPTDGSGPPEGADASPESNALQVDETKKRDFAKAVQTYLPSIKASQLSPAYAGIRPKLYGPKAPSADFIIERFDECPRVVHLVGIESPGRTASAAIAEEVEAQVAELCD